jgi:hypothetical protein
MRPAIAFVAVVALALGACGKKDEPPKPASNAPASTQAAPSTGVAVSAVTLGSGINALKRVVNATDSFSRTDTIYASVDTTGAGSSTLTAKWTYRANGQDVPVHQDSQTVNPTGPATTEFHVSKPDGWPAGDYRFDVSTSGGSQGGRNFTVK